MKMKSHVLHILLSISLTLLIASAIATVYFRATLTNTGSIIAHGCKVYLEDETTESYSVNWGDIAVNSSAIQYRWIHNNGTGANVEWGHDAPSYLQPKIYYEQPVDTWNLWDPGTLLSFSQGQWLHIKLELTSLPDAINHIGSFHFNTYIELT